MSWKLTAFVVLITSVVAQNEESDAEVVNVPEKVPPPPPGPLDECDPEMIGFELVTGYVFSAPGNVLDSIPGTLMLTDCLETCQGNDSCRSVNYETGLCILFSSNADALPGKRYFIILITIHVCRTITRPFCLIVYRNCNSSVNTLMYKSFYFHVRTS